MMIEKESASFMRVYIISHSLFKSLFFYLKGTAGVHVHASHPHLRLRSRESMSQVLVLVNPHLHLQFNTSIPSSCAVMRSPSLTRPTPAGVPVKMRSPVLSR